MHVDEVIYGIPFFPVIPSCFAFMPQYFITVEVVT